MLLAVPYHHEDNKLLILLDQIRTFPKTLALPSIIVTRVRGLFSAQTIPAKKPAAPPPIIIISNELLNVE